MTLRVGVIGTGGIGEGHVHRIAKVIAGAEVVAVNDINAESANRVAKQYGARVEPSAHSLINADDVDAVIIASWDPTHEEYSIESIKAGKYVFCEKPLATSAQGCKNIMAAEIAGGKRLLQVGFMRRYDESYRQLKKAIDEGKVGAPLIVYCQHRNKQPVGAKHTTDTLIKRAMVHEFDIVRWLLGEEYESVQFIGPKSTRYANQDLMDPQKVLMKTKSGVVIDLEIFMNCRYGYDVQCEIVGEDGTIRLPDPANVIIRQNGASSYEIYSSWKERFRAAYEVELREWVESIKDGNLVGPTAWDAYITCAVADACVQSREEKRIIPIVLDECPEMYR
jgi:myo-inositol 2-dehydrogenase/D-chiro-inositol 1-dehydrogenase